MLRHSKALIFICSIWIGSFSLVQAQNNPLEGSVITDPSISRRCEELLSERKKRLNHKLRIMELISRNKKLRKNASSKRPSLIKKLEINYRNLELELQLIRTKLAHGDETIVKKGCPGIVL